MFNYEAVTYVLVNRLEEPLFVFFVPLIVYL